MPMPMMTILEALEKLQDDQALFVYHKRIPVFLLPELSERKFDYRIKEISDGEIHLIIFKS
jgi:TusA-related sulfurtransferase